jgi:hypothetical protein
MKARAAPKYVSCITYHKGDQSMILQVDTHTLVFAALIPDRILPNIQDFGGEFVTIDRPKSNPQNGEKKKKKEALGNQL